MNIFRRLKNLWILSEWEPGKPGEVLPIGTFVSTIHKKPAQVIDMAPEVELD